MIDMLQNSIHDLCDFNDFSQKVDLNSCPAVTSLQIFLSLLELTDVFLQVFGLMRS